MNRITQVVFEKIHFFHIHQGLPYKRIVDRKSQALKFWTMNELFVWSLKKRIILNAYDFYRNYWKIDTNW